MEISKHSTKFVEPRTMSCLLMNWNQTYEPKDRHTVLMTCMPPECQYYIY